VENGEGRRRNRRGAASRRTDRRHGRGQRLVDARLTELSDVI